MKLTTKVKVHSTTSVLTMAGLVTALGAPWKWSFFSIF